jgi:hypothetical protein
MGARPVLGSVMGPCETLSGDGLAFLLELGAPFVDERGDRLTPVAYCLQTYSRNPAGKHRCLELALEQGIALPDTPAMAVHRGRIDLLRNHLERDPALLTRTFTHADLFPPELGCTGDPLIDYVGTPLAGGTLLHLCVDGDELEIARWLLDAGMPVDAPAAVDGDGFGGHTALFGCVVSQPRRVGLRTDDAFARLLLDRGADPNAQASLRKRHPPEPDAPVLEWRNVRPHGWGEAFSDRRWVNVAAMQLIAARGGRA